MHAESSYVHHEVTLAMALSVPLLTCLQCLSASSRNVLRGCRWGTGAETLSARTLAIVCFIQSFRAVTCQLASKSSWCWSFRPDRDCCDVLHANASTCLLQFDCCAFYQSSLRPAVFSGFKTQGNKSIKDGAEH